MYYKLKTNMCSLKPDSQTLQYMGPPSRPPNQSSLIMEKRRDAKSAMNPLLAYEVAEQGRKQVESRSEKNQVNSNFEISFEKGILESHKKAIQNIFERYSGKMGQILNNSEVKLIDRWEKNGLSEQETGNNKMETIIKQCSYFQTKHKTQLIQDFKNQTELTDLFLFTYARASPTIQPDLCFLFAFLWEQYIIANKNHLLKPKLKTQFLKKSITDQIHQLLPSQQLKNITFLSTHQIDPQIIEHHFLWLLHSLAQTVALVIDGYFENPLEQVQEIGEDDEMSNIRRLSWLSLNDSEGEQVNSGCALDGEPLKKVKRY